MVIVFLLNYKSLGIRWTPIHATVMLSKYKISFLAIVVACIDNKKPPRWAVVFPQTILTFAELSRTTSFAETVVLTFNDTAVAGQESSRL